MKVPSLIEESKPTGLQKFGAIPDSIKVLNKGDFGVSSNKHDKTDLNKNKNQINLREKLNKKFPLFLLHFKSLVNILINFPT